MRKFLGLIMIFIFSFCVSAQNRQKENSDYKFEQFLKATGINGEDLEGSLGTKKEFEISMKNNLMLWDKRIEEAKVFQKKVEELFKKLEKSPTDLTFKEILSLAIEKFKENLEVNDSSDKGLKSKRDEEEEKHEEKVKNYVKDLERLKKKDSLNDREKEDIRTDLREMLEMVAKEEIQYNEMVKEEFSKLNYEDLKKWISKRWFSRFMQKNKIPLLVGFIILVVGLIVLFITKFVFMKSRKNKKQQKSIEKNQIKK